MRTSIAAVLLLVALAAPARAQVLLGYLFGEKLASPTFNMGFEVGANFARLDGLGDGERANHPVFGLFADWRFSEHVHCGGAVLPFAGRGAEGLAPIATGDPAFDGQLSGASMTRSLGYVEIPLALKWAPRREEGFRAGAGPSFGIVTGAHDRYLTASPGGNAYALERELDVPGLDFGISGEAEWRFRIFAVAVRYTHGLTDMAAAGDPGPVHTRVLTGTGRIALGKKPAD
jgi:hypothetical protein